MRRRIGIFSPFSLLFLVLTISMCIRSYFRGDYYVRYGHGSGVMIGSVIGFICIDHWEMDPRPSIHDHYYWRNSSRWGSMPAVSPKFRPPRNLLERLGFFTHYIQSWSTLGYRWLIPYWPFIVLFALRPSADLVRICWRRRARYRAAHGLCTRCGYDLRESKERCPECGTAVVRGANPTAVC